MNFKKNKKFIITFIAAVLLWCTGYSFFNFKLNGSFGKGSVARFEKLFQEKEEILHESVLKISTQINENKSIDDIYHLTKKIQEART